MNILRAHLENEPGDASAKENLAVLESVAYSRQETAHEGVPPAMATAAQKGKGGLTTEEKVLLGAAGVGGVALILLSGGTAAPAVIVGLEAAGDAAIGTELAAGTAVVGEAVAGGEAITGLTASRVTGLGTAATTAAAAVQTPQGQEALKSIEDNLPAVESQA
jgi:hypothetical protein